MSDTTVGLAAAHIGGSFGAQIIPLWSMSLKGAGTVAVGAWVP